MTKSDKRQGQKVNNMLEKEGEVDFTSSPLKDKVGVSLKRLYDDVVKEPVPDDFLKLLAEADKASK